jgi:far upstream element-binding protein
VGGGGGSGGGGGGGMDTRQAQAKQANQPALREGENSSQIMVPDKTVGLIIGRGGETIRDLQERSGCHINIVGENKSVNGLRPVNLIGNAQAAALAKELIMEIVESDTRNGGQGLQEPSRAAAPPRDQYPPPDSGKLSESIYVPSDAVGMIIGKGISTFTSYTRLHTNLSQAVKPSKKCRMPLVARSTSRNLAAQIVTVR